MLFARRQWQEAHAGMELANSCSGRSSVDIPLQVDCRFRGGQSEHRHRPVCCPDRDGDAGANAELGGVGIEGPDIAKHVFQVHGVDRDGNAVLRRKVRRAEVAGFFDALWSCAKPSVSLASALE